MPLAPSIDTTIKRNLSRDLTHTHNPPFDNSALQGGTNFASDCLPSSLSTRVYVEHKRCHRRIARRLMSLQRATTHACIVRETRDPDARSVAVGHRRAHLAQVTHQPRVHLQLQSDDRSAIPLDLHGTFIGRQWRPSVLCSSLNACGSLTNAEWLVRLRQW